MGHTGIKYREIMPCLLSIILDNMGFTMVYPLLTAILSTEGIFAYGTSSALIQFYLGLGYLLYPLAMFFGASFMGDFSDVLGRKKVLIICMIGLFISFFLMGLGVSLSSLTLILIGRAFSGLMAGSQPIAQAAVVDLSPSEEKTWNMTLITLTICVGIIIGPAIGGILSVISYSTPFYFSAAISILAAIWVQISFHETFKHQSEKVLHFLRPIMVIKEALIHKSVRLLALVFILMQAGFSLFFQYNLVRLEEKYEFGSLGLGMFIAFIGVCFSIALLYVIKPFIKKWCVKKITIIFLTITGLSQIVAGFVHPLGLIFLFTVPLAMGDIIAYTLMLTNFSNAVDHLSQGWAMGVAVGSMGIAWTLTGLFSNLLLLVGTEAIIIFGGLLLLLSAFFMWIYTKQTPTKKVATEETS